MSARALSTLRLLALSRGGPDPLDVVLAGLGTQEAADFAAFDRFMTEAPPDLPLSLDGDCPCGGILGAHQPGCPHSRSAPEDRGGTALAGCNPPVECASSARDGVAKETGPEGAALSAVPPGAAAPSARSPARRRPPSDAEIELEQARSEPLEDLDGRIASLFADTAAFRQEAQQRAQGAQAFHDHLDTCAQCRTQIFELCPVGAQLLAASAGGRP